MNELPWVHETGTDQIPRYRLVAWGKAACDPFDTHFWVRFINVAIPGETILILCRNCGLTPLEALSRLPIVVPT